MLCEEVEIRIQELLDQRKAVDSDPEVAAHMAICPGCRQRVAAYQAMLDGVQSLPLPQPSGAFDAAVLQRVIHSATVSRRASGRGLPFASALAVAASLLVAGFFWFRGQQPDHPGGETIAVPAHEPSGSTGFAWTLPGPVPSERIHSACIHTGRNMATLPEKFRRAALSPDDTGLAGRIRPVTRPMGVAWGILKRTLPASTEKTSHPDRDTGWILAPGELVLS